MEAHPRLDNEEFFALPQMHELQPPGGVSGFGLAVLKDEGAPIYRDEHGDDWIMQEVDGIRCRAELF